MTITKLHYALWDNLDSFDLGDSGAMPGEWNGSKALYLSKVNAPIHLREAIPFEAFRIQAQVAIPGEVGFIGFIFGAKDQGNYELVYLAPVEIQYDPIMNGSMTWQIYNGPMYQKPLPNTTGQWQKFTLEVQANGVSVFLGDDPKPQLVIPNLQHGDENRGNIGIWNFLPTYIRDLTIEEIQPAPIAKRTMDMKQLQSDSFVTEWLVSSPYTAPSSPDGAWTKAVVEENGVLNINRIHKAEPGISVEAKCEIIVPEEKESLLSFGFSDRIRLWVNDQEVYQGNWNWNPPASDGRIQGDFAGIPVKWRAGLNTVRAEVTQNESFGWGLAMRTGLSAIPNH
ncbi:MULTISPECIES: hypothetical protein [unclassified Paenibacillus]|uniref:hypothetical protein n=1 Tax=unclassified Paenibacillus TaxID=185978 RepID=UPI0030F9BF6B